MLAWAFIVTFDVVGNLRLQPFYFKRTLALGVAAGARVQHFVFGYKAQFRTRQIALQGFQLPEPLLAGN